MSDTPGHLSIPTCSVHEAAARLGVHPKTIRRWIHAGQLPATQAPGPYGPAPGPPLALALAALKTFLY